MHRFTPIRKSRMFICERIDTQCIMGDVLLHITSNKLFRCQSTRFYFCISVYGRIVPFVENVNRANVYHYHKRPILKVLSFKYIFRAFWPFVDARTWEKVKGNPWRHWKHKSRSIFSYISMGKPSILFASYALTAAALPLHLVKIIIHPTFTTLIHYHLRK